jgi:hypothetical protein
MLNRINKSEDVLTMLCAKPRIRYVKGSWVQFPNDQDMRRSIMAIRVQSCWGFFLGSAFFVCKSLHERIK